MLIQNKVLLEYDVPTSSTIPTLTSVGVFCPSPTCINKRMSRKSSLRTRSCSLFIIFFLVRTCKERKKLGGLYWFENSGCGKSHDMVYIILLNVSNSNMSYPNQRELVYLVFLFSKRLMVNCCQGRDFVLCNMHI